MKDLIARIDIDDNVDVASQFDTSEESEHFLNEDITAPKVHKDIMKLKGGKPVS